MYLLIYLIIGLVLAAIDVIYNQDPLKWITSIVGKRIIWLGVFGYMILWPLILSVQAYKIFNDINK